MRKPASLRAIVEQERRNGKRDPCGLLRENFSPANRTTGAIWEGEEEKSRRGSFRASLNRRSQPRIQSCPLCCCCRHEVTPLSLPRWLQLQPPRICARTP